MKLYHGSTVSVKNPNLRQGRPNTDYGKGLKKNIICIIRKTSGK